MVKSRFNVVKLLLNTVGLPIALFLVFGFKGFNFFSSEEWPTSFGDWWFLVMLLLGVILTIVHIFQSTNKLFITDKSLEVKGLIPLLDRDIFWRNLDGFMVAENGSRSYKSNEVIWLIRDQKVVLEISSSLYANYDEVFQKIDQNLTYKGNIFPSPLDRLKTQFQVRNKKLPQV